MSLNRKKKRGTFSLSKVSLMLFTLLLLGFALSGCEEDDAALQEDGIQQGQDNQLFESQIRVLQMLVSAMDGSRTISKITQTDAEYTLIFNDGTSVEIKNGKEGESVPGIGISLDGDVYYWSKGKGTKRWLTDNSGNKIPVSDKNELIPRLNQKEGYWYVSVDNGISWEKLGEVATSETGGSSLFESITQNGELIFITLNDGTKFQVPMTGGLKIQLSTMKVIIKAGVELKVAYELLNVEGNARVEILESDIVTATVVDPSARKGEIKLFAADISAINEFTKVVIKATDDAGMATATITFDEEGVLNVAETFSVDAAGQLLSIPVKTNLSYTVEIEKDAQVWLSHQPKTRALHTEIEVFKIEANDTDKERPAIILFKSGDIERKVAVVQEKKASTDEGPTVGNVELDRLYGYGVETTGGAGATAANILHFDNGICFRDFLKSREGNNKDKSPVIIYLSGKFTKNDGRDSSSPWFDIKDTENLSIYGVDGFVMENVGFFLNRANNIIIRNIYIKMPKADNGADGISMQNSNKVWVDHCTFESINQVLDYEDGSCDITHATKNVTVSWCHFIRTQKSCLVGHSNSNTEDVDITATFHHNYFDKSSSRHPRVRYGRVHVYNNYFNEVTTYGVGSAYGAMVLVESNSFNGVVLPTDICTFPAKPSGSSMVSNLQGSVAGYLYEMNNEYLNKPEKAGEVYPFINLEWESYNGNKRPSPFTYADFKPTYGYIVDEADRVPTIVSSSAGTRKLPGYDKAPIEVNNGGFTPGGTDPEQPTDPEEPDGTELANGWKWAAYNNSSAAASVASGVLTLTANGKFEGANQTFGYVYREVTGDFVATVQVDSYDTPGSSNQSLAGLILAPSFAATASNFLHTMAAQGPSNAFYRSVRVAVGNSARGVLTAPAVTGTEKAIMKLERAGNTCIISYSLDGGVSFSKTRTETFEMGLLDTIYLGMAVSSGDSSKAATAVFSHFMLNDASISF